MYTGMPFFMLTGVTCPFDTAHAHAFPEKRASMPISDANTRTNA
jgi:hypothetical protein